MSDLSNVIRGVCEEKGLKYEDVIIAIEFSLAAAYRKDYGNKNQNIKVKFNPETGSSIIEDVKLVVENLPEDFFEKEAERKENEIKNNYKEKDNEDGDGAEEERKFYPKTEIQLADAQLIKKNAKVGDEIKMDLEEPGEYGRMASQTAKQVIVQKIREMEREMIYEEFKVYIKSVTLETRGPRIILSRISEEVVKALFYMEIPELSSGVIELKAIARTAGSRLKVAVSAEVDNIDPIGSCVGQKGARIQTIIGELNGEKIDIIEYNEEPSKFVSNALSPAKVVSVEIDEEKKIANVGDQFSLAIGKRGENIRLASALTGYEIKIYEDGVEQKDEKASDEAEVEGEQENIDEELEKKEDDKKGKKSAEDENVEAIEEVEEKKEKKKK